jgi:hypothetical protein
MRPWLLILGIVIVIPGLVLLLVPLVPHPAKDITAATFLSYHATERIPLLSTLPVAVSWTSGHSVSVRVYDCSTFVVGAANVSALCPGASYQTETGTSGSATVSVPVNGGVAVALAPGSPNGTVSVTLKATSPTVGLGLIGLGALVAVLGLVFKRRPVTPKVPTPASGAAEGATASTPPSESEEGLPEGEYAE